MMENTPHAESFVEIEQRKRPYVPKFWSKFSVLFFGGGASMHQFWQNLAEGVNLWTTSLY